MDARPTPDLDGLLSELVSAQLADQVLTEMEIRANDLGRPVVGRAVGRFLELQVRAIGARRVVDVGGNGGYTAWWLAGAIGDGGQVVALTTDDRELASATSALRRAGRWRPVHPSLAEPGEGLASLTGAVDAVHLHAEVVRAEDGVRVWHRAVATVRPGGLVLATGVAPAGVLDAAGLAVCRAAADEPALISSVVPIRDGVLVALRTGEPTAAAPS